MRQKEQEAQFQQLEARHFLQDQKQLPPNEGRENFQAEADQNQFHSCTTHPENLVAGVAKAQGSKPGLLCLSFHYEATEPRGMTQELIDSIKSHNMKVGLVISPDTPVEAILKYADQIDLALIMTVYPGKGGQSFMESMMTKVKTLREKYPTLDIELDGGIKPHTIAKGAEAGANLFVSGSAL